ncbi:hypothetical protein OO007_15795 [Cocleimonas sp. KMM 6892]|uniref:hypothetical protein n=1 Tax=unclassified Cocleimonas TaxID=2639732 RepID=UPI002DBEB323|nr:MULTISPECIES: hypothetical protein [unclassified Cocleimonas]MEB8433702.1 hypothetical protein [Cocleimonas sp. KMM 6892]MEC4716513.1 hypothetical protein [Cocleimonas sp. KMM 6895]MEC4745594.1 hypothetical protein [Cocleimonas sp. KMM 6896]
MITVSKIFLAMTLSTLLVACSNAPVQTKRLNTVEDLVVGAERVLSNNTNPNAKQYAKQNLDTAGAYLLTLRDNKKILSDDQLKRYNALTQRISVLQKQTN